MKSTLDEQLKELGEDLQVKPQAKDELKRRVLHNMSESGNVRRKKYGWVAAAICLLVLTSPFYSTTMASLASKILPLDIRSSFSEEGFENLSGALLKLVEEEGYMVNSVGVTPSPYTIEINLLLDGTTLKKAKEHLLPLVEGYLHENGYDQYKLVFSEADYESFPGGSDEEISLLDQVSEIVNEVFAAYGYAEEAAQQGIGMNREWGGNIVALGMPDHITEAEEIVADLKKEFKARDMDIKDIELETYNLADRQQDGRWGRISSDIYSAMAGRSAYQVTGLSYKVKKGHSYVWLKTDWKKPPGGELIEEIEAAVRKYLATPETAEHIKDDAYTIQFELKDGTPFAEVTNEE